MSIKKIHDDQPKDFKFSEDNLKKAEEILNKYPDKNKKKCCNAVSLFGSKTK